MFVWVVKLSQHGNSSAPSAFGTRSSCCNCWCWWTSVNKILKWFWPAFFSCFTNRLVTLFSALYCGIHCICCNINRYQNSPAFSDWQYVTGLGENHGIRTIQWHRSQWSAERVRFRPSAPGNRSDARSDTFWRGKSRRTDLCYGHYSLGHTHGKAVAIPDIETRPEPEIVIPAEIQVSMSAICEQSLGAARPCLSDTASQYVTADKPETTATFNIVWK